MFLVSVLRTLRSPNAHAALAESAHCIGGLTLRTRDSPATRYDLTSVRLIQGPEQGREENTPCLSDTQPSPVLTRPRKRKGLPLADREVIVHASMPRKLQWPQNPSDPPVVPVGNCHPPVGQVGWPSPSVATSWSPALLVPCHEASPKAILLQDLAMAALSFPTFQKSFLVRFTSHQMHSRRTMIRYGLSVTEPGMDGIPTWLPNQKCPLDMVSSYFATSIIGPDGHRYHNSQKEAVRYCFMMAIMKASSNTFQKLMCTKDYLGDRHFRTLHEAHSSSKKLVAVILRQPGSVFSFTFLDPSTCKSIGQVKHYNVL